MPINTIKGQGTAYKQKQTMHSDAIHLPFLHEIQNDPERSKGATQSRTMKVPVGRTRVTSWLGRIRIRTVRTAGMMLEQKESSYQYVAWHSRPLA